MLLTVSLTTVLYYAGWVLTAIEFVSFIIALVKAIKNKQFDKVKELAIGFIKEAETLTAKNGSPVSGATKKEVVLSKIRITCSNLHMSYNETLWSGVVDQLVDFTLRVNQRATDVAKVKEIDQAKEQQTVEAK
jgi:hypothetical protein